jgi:hypothetical protein
MSHRTIPRFFSGRPDASRNDYPHEIDPTQVIDSFFVSGRVVTEQEWAVTVDPYGRLQGWVINDSTVLPPELQSQLTYNDVAHDSRVRCLDARTFYLFHMQLLEQPADAPGLNDPVYLYGTLYGPYPEAGSDPCPGIEGQLTVTRADLLDGIVNGNMYSFKSAPEGGAGPAQRTFNILLPGDRDEEINSGRGLVMMYPLHPAEMINTGTANEIVVSQLLYDVLSSLKDDLVRNKVNNPLRNMILPVPNRYVMEQDLIAQGYKIKNGVAIRSKLVSTNQFSGVLASVFGDMAADRLELPPEASVDDLIAIAKDVINRLPGWPPSRTRILRDRCQPVSADVRMRAANSAPLRAPIIHTPQKPEQHHAPHVVPGKPAPSQQPDAWMQDFMQSHRKEGAPPPRITTLAQPRKHNPEWQNDFVQSNKPKQETTSPPKEEKPEKKPDWMKDFE